MARNERNIIEMGLGEERATRKRDRLSGSMEVIALGRAREDRSQATFGKRENTLEGTGWPSLWFSCSRLSQHLSVSRVCLEPCTVGRGLVERERILPRDEGALLGGEAGAL